MSEERIGPEKCMSCGSARVIGPNDVLSAAIRVGLITGCRMQAFVCGDCGHVMLFTHEKDEKKIQNEVDRILNQSR